MRPSSTAVPVNAVRQALPPVLHQALTNLDMQIEEELARYRRQRHQRTGTPRPTASLTAPKTASKTLDLIAIPALGGRTQPWPAANGASKADGAASLDAGRSQPEQSVWDSTPAAMGTAAVLDSGANLGGAVVVSRAVESELDGHGTHSLDQSSLAQRNSDQSVDSTLGSNIARIDAAMIDRDRSGEPLSVTASTMPTATDGHLEDYLESSEALLQSLAEEEAQVRAETGFMKSLVTPVGVGSMLLLLLSSSLLGYVLMNPGSFGQLLSMNLGNPPNAAPVSSVASSPTDEAPLSPLEPNLAAQEFKDLNLNTLGTLKLNGRTSPSSTLPSTGLKPTGNPAAKAGGTPGQPTLGSGSKPRIALSDNASRQSTGAAGPSIVLSQRVAPTYGPTSPIPTYRPPQPQPRSQPSAYRPTAPTRISGQSGNRPQTAPPPAAPMASPSSSPVASPTAPSPATRRTVVVPFTHDRDLDAAQRVDPNARMDSSFNDGITRINVGTYTDESAARERVEQLQKQGVNAQIREENDVIK